MTPIMESAFNENPTFLNNKLSLTNGQAHLLNYAIIARDLQKVFI